MRPNSVNVIGIEYKIFYVDKPSDVDIYHRQSLWGQTDFWTRTIRVYDGGRPEEDIFQTLMHEVLHAVAEALKLSLNKDDMHDELDVLALALTDILFRNNLIIWEHE